MSRCAMNRMALTILLLRRRLFRRQDERVVVRRRLAVVDQIAAPLQIAVTHELVLVKRGRVEDLRCVEELRAALDELADTDLVAGARGIYVRERIGIDVDGPAERIAQVARAEQRN